MKRRILTIIFLVLPLFAYLQVNVDAQEIISKINKGEDIFYQNATIIGDLDFRLINDVEKDSEWEFFGNDNITYKYNVHSTLKFVQCEFKGNVIGYWSDDYKDELHIAHFYEDVHFEECVFKDDFLVKYSEFKEKAAFPGNTFEEDALFKYSEFHSTVDFSHSVFLEEANFKYAKFPEYTVFENSTFNDLANFKYTKFSGEVNFKNCNFEKSAYFKYTELSDFIDFSNARFMSEAIFKYIEFSNGVNFKKCCF